MAVRSFDPKGTPEAQLRFFVEMFGPEERRLIRAVRSAVRKRLPTANELVYDYDTFFVIGYSPTDHPTDGIVAIAARPDGVRLYLMYRKPLPDPKKLLSGSGKQARFIRVEAASRLAHPDVEALIAAAIDQARIPLPSRAQARARDKTGGRLVIRSISVKRQSRRKR